MPSKFSGLRKPLANMVSGPRKVLRRLFGAKQKGNIVQPPEADTPDLAAIPQSYDINEIGRISEGSPEPSIDREVDYEASESAMGVVQPSSQEDRNDPSDLSEVKSVLLGSTEKLGKTDMLLARAYFEEIGYENVAEASKKHMESRDEEIQMKLGRDGQTQSWSNEEVFSIAQKVLTVHEALVNNVLQTEIGASLEPEFSTDDLVEFRLHSGELLKPRIRKYLEAMFAAFALQLDCCKVNHFMRLKLTGFVDQVDHEKPTFFDLYLSSGHDSDTLDRELTQGEVTDCTLIKKSILDKRKLDVLLKETYNQNHNTQNTSAMKSTQENSRPLQLNVSEELSSLATPIVSLASLMKQYASSDHIRRVWNAEPFSPNERDWLCLNLSLSLFHMSSRNWNRATWYSDDPNTEIGIFFLRDPSTQEIVDKTRPYMSWRLQEESEVLQRTAKGLVYDTQLLSFAKLLIEVHTWRKLDLTPEPKSEEELRSRLRKYIDANINSPRDLKLISALKACLGHVGRIDATAEDKPERIQMYVFKNIVTPLHEYLGTPNLPKSTLAAMPPYDQAVLDGSNESTNDTPIYDTRINDGKHEEKSPYEKQEFWNKMEIFIKNYISPLALSDDVKPWPEKKVRIAVIDSGVKEEDAEIAAAAITERIRGYRNFTSPDINNCEDQIDHGTRVARLLLTVAPEAELYIAKVTDATRIPKNQLHRIAEAIKWAVLEWDVDIISISLALYDEHYDINEEITEALSPSSQDAKRKLVFAAAGNRGPFERRAFPARNKGVIAVHATDWSGGGAKFNPNPEGELNLSTLGENIKIRWPDPDNHGEMGDAYISGSSFATPIAAGIAANVLEFARYRLKLNGWKKDVIYSHPVIIHSSSYQLPHVSLNMDLVSKKPTQSISDASQKGVSLFRSCSLRTTHAVIEFQEMERLFRAWTERLSVFSQSASLDMRLRAEKYDKFRPIVMDYLDVLNVNLSLAHKIVSSNKNEQIVKQSLEILLFSIGKSLERLDWAASAIGQASQGKLINRTIVFARKHDDFKRLTRMFSLVILWRYAPKDQLGNMPLKSLEALIPSEKKILQRHPKGLFLALIKTSIVRHFGILYERNRRDKENKGLAALAMRSPKPQGSTPADGDTITAQYKSPQPNQPAPGEANQAAKRDDEARSENQLTVLSIDVDRYNTGRPTSDEKPAPLVSEAGGASFPRAPKIPNGQTKGTCPICKQEFPAEELQGAKWIAHATKDIKPYVCIFGDCMSGIQFFERRRDWIYHMHEFHSSIWIPPMLDLWRWECSLCCSDSDTEFIFEEGVKTSFMEHLEQSHPDTDTESRQGLVNNCAVPHFRSPDHCPICGTLHQPAIPLEPQSETASNSGAKETEKAAQSQHKPKVRFAAPERPTGEDERCPAESSSLDPQDWRSTRATGDQGVENCIAEHLRELALYFSDRLNDDDDQRDSDISSGDEIDRFPVPDEEKVEIRECIARNLRELCEKRDEQTNWNFNWVDGHRIAEPNMSDEERERLFPENDHPGNDDGLQSRASEIQELDDPEVKTTAEPKVSDEKRESLFPDDGHPGNGHYSWSELDSREIKNTNKLPLGVAKDLKCQRDSPRRKWFQTLLEKAANVNIRGDAGNRSRGNQDENKIRSKFLSRTKKRAR
ncbi:uncharacterized protein Triagg1_2213 [Trichoderma aggressivum f. europaeum]|uniref:Peptidase S8/S53 domain-containing protein n=1 Tax=Trichoderma aggressivum f. europaeum TaxID=173218 RepID=A0AAE1IKT9_9HYPO|nr:hypothetical protein Triagg1_2213 [Trichoderma aggressivum f. europaeum]